MIDPRRRSHPLDLNSPLSKKRRKGKGRKEGDTRLVVERERERHRVPSAEYWDPDREKRKEKGLGNEGREFDALVQNQESRNPPPRRDQLPRLCAALEGKKRKEGTKKKEERKQIGFGSNSSTMAGRA